MIAMAFIFSLVFALYYFLIAAVAIYPLAYDQQTIVWMIHSTLFLIMFLVPVLDKWLKLDPRIKLNKFLLNSAYFLMGAYFIFFTLATFNFLILMAKGQPLSIGRVFYLFIMAFLLSLWGQLKLKFMPLVKSVQLDRLERLPEGFSIVQISDLHLGPSVDLDYGLKVAAKVNECRPDVIVLTGDIIDGKFELYRDLLQVLAQLKAKHGVYFCPGNHEYYWEFLKWIPAISEQGVQVLLNESKTIKWTEPTHLGNQKEYELFIAGTHDLHAERIFPAFKFDPQAALLHGSTKQFRLLLTHQPNGVKALLKPKSLDGVLPPHLVLAGHTHAGQFFPANLLIYFFQTYVKGLYHLKNHAGEVIHLYVNSGTGFWGPKNRLGTDAEITHFIFK